MPLESRQDLFCRPRPEIAEQPDGSVVWLAPAKLNLSLRVLGRRGDDFHELDSIVAKVTLYDELCFRRREDGQLRLACSGYDCGRSEDNLVLRAAERLRASRQPLGADVQLVKRIPPGAGLGGGSSDAAAALKALNRLWRLNLTLAELSAAAADLGSDVPLFLCGPAARIRGRGEHVEPLTVYPFHALLYLPDLPCPTGQVYAAYDALQRRRGGGEGRPPPARPGELLLSAGRLAERPSAWRDELVNDLESAAMQVAPRLKVLWQRLEGAVGLSLHMTGSGSAMFMLLDDELQARQALAAVPQAMQGRCRLVQLNPS